MSQASFDLTPEFWDAVNVVAHKSGLTEVGALALSIRLSRFLYVSISHSNCYIHSSGYILNLTASTCCTGQAEKAEICTNPAFVGAKDRLQLGSCGSGTLVIRL